MMIHFSNPAFLLLIFLAPLLVWWWLRRRGDALRFPNTIQLQEIPSGRGRLVRWGGVTMRTLALLLLILTLAGPRWPDRSTRVATEGIAIEMVADVSGSMAESDFRWQGMPITRLEAVKKAFRLFVMGGQAEDGTTFEGRPNDLIGLIVFGTRPEALCPLTLSHSVLLQFLDVEQPRSLPGESTTNLSDAMILAISRLQSAGPQRKVMILLSDGENNVFDPSSKLTPRQVAQIAVPLGVAVYAIDAGGQVPSKSSTAAGSDAAANRAEGMRTLQELARMTQGRYFAAHDTQNLLDVWRVIDGLEREKIPSHQYRRYYETYPWLGLGAMVLWILVWILELTTWQRLP